MRQPNFGMFHIRKWCLQIESTRAAERGHGEPGTDPQRIVVLAAVLENPFLVESCHVARLSLSNTTDRADEFGNRLLTALKGRPIWAMGQAFIVRLDGERHDGIDLMSIDFTARVLASAAACRHMASEEAFEKASTLAWAQARQIRMALCTTRSLHALTMRRRERRCF